MSMRVVSFVALVVVGLVSSVAFAAGGDGGSHTPPMLEVLAYLLNFLIYASLVVFFAGKPIKAYFDQRRAVIADQIEASRKLHDEAKATLEEYGARLAAFDKERDAILAEFRAAGEAEASRIVAEAEAQAAKVRRDASDLADREQRMARTGLEQRLVDRAVEVAVDELGRQLNPMMQSRLIDRSIDSLADAERS